MLQIDPKYSTDGERIIKPSNGQAIPPDEPLILFRARDHLALTLLRIYRELCEIDGCTEFHLKCIDGRIEAFSDFKRQHPERMKQPGCTMGK